MSSSKSRPTSPGQTSPSSGHSAKLSSKSTKDSSTTTGPEWNYSTKISPSPAVLSSHVKRTLRVSQTEKMMRELQEELKKEKEEKSRLLQDLAVLRKSRRSVEEAGHLINGGMHYVDHHADDEVSKLQNELKLALEATEESKKAMDELAAALNEARMEANQLKERMAAAQIESESVAEADKRKERLSAAWIELENARADADRLIEDNERLKTEAEAWDEKVRQFIVCMKDYEEEINKLKQENLRLAESERAIKDEVSKLRDLLQKSTDNANAEKEELEAARGENSGLKNPRLTESERAIKDEVSNLRDLLQKATDNVNVAKEELEAARGENSGLKNLLSEKESALESIRQENETLKANGKSGRISSEKGPWIKKKPPIHPAGSLEKDNYVVVPEDEIKPIDGTRAEGDHRNMVNQKKQKKIFRGCMEIFGKKAHPSTASSSRCF